MIFLDTGFLTTVETSWHRSRKGKGALIGALVGLGTAVALGFAIGDDCGPIQGDELFARLVDNLCVGKGEAAAVVGILTVPAGALLGLAVAPGEKWHPSSSGTPERQDHAGTRRRRPDRLAPLLRAVGSHASQPRRSGRRSA